MSQTVEATSLTGMSIAEPKSALTARSTRPRFLRFVVFAVIVQMVPALLPTARLLTVDAAIVYAVAAVGLNVIFGYGGLISVGQAAVMAVGGYALVIIFDHNVGLAPSLLGACAAGAIVSVVMGLVGARIKTHYFILASLAVAEIIVLFITNQTGLTGGAIGKALTGDATVAGFDLRTTTGFFRVASVVVLIVVYLADTLRASREGLALSALTMNEHLALAAGVNPQASRVLATAVGGIFGALGGAMLGLLDGFLGPQDFDLKTATLLLLIVVVAGRARNGSVIVAALILTFLSQGFLTLQAVGQLVYGLGLIVLIIVAPQGLHGLVEWIRVRARRVPWSPSTRWVGRR